MVAAAPQSSTTRLVHGESAVNAIGAGDHKGRPYGTATGRTARAAARVAATARTVGDGLVPSRALTSTFD